jgi:NCAIR mutase (PurE)-related protein
VDRDRLRTLLEAVREGQVAPEVALEALSVAPYVEAFDSRIDLHRAMRQGLPEVVYGAGKTPRQIADAVRILVAHGQPALVTRVAPDAAEQVLAELPSGEYLGDARLLWFGPPPAPTARHRGGGVRGCGPASAREACGGAASATRSSCWPTSASRGCIGCSMRCPCCARPRS